MPVDATFEIKLSVTSISPNVGSTAGGTLVTIVGENFSLIKK